MSGNDKKQKNNIKQNKFELFTSKKKSKVELKFIDNFELFTFDYYYWRRCSIWSPKVCGHDVHYFIAVGHVYKSNRRMRLVL